MRRRAPRRRIRLALAVLLSVAPAGVAGAEDDGPFNKTEAQEVVAQAATDARLQAMYRSCPADIFRKKMPIWNVLNTSDKVEESVCAAHPAKCYRACVNWRDAQYCFRLGITFQNHEADLDPVHAQPFFAMACATGEPAGCTNRAAGILNVAHASDPMKDAPSAEKRLCTFRSFAIACDNDDAWGCTMAGLAYRNGDGTDKNPEKAKASFDKACKIDPDFEACDYAKELSGARPDEPEE